MQTCFWDSFCSRYNINRSLIDRVYATLPLDHNESWIAGGAIRDTIMGERPKDWDVFFTTEEAFAKAVDRFDAISAFKQINSDRIASAGSAQTYETLVNVDGDDALIEVQLVPARYSKTLESLLQTFDFTICQFGIKIMDEIPRLAYGEFSLYDLARKELRINHLTHPESLPSRIGRFMERGFVPSYETEKAAKAISETV